MLYARSTLFLGGFGLLWWLTGATPALAQPRARPASDDRPAGGAVHRMEINNGTNRTVRYFGAGLSPGEVGSLRGLERAENDITYLDDLQTLKRQYVNDDRLLQAQRSAAQLQLYGTSTTTTSYGGLGYGGLYSGYGYGYGGWYGYRYPYGGYAYPFATAVGLGANSTTVTRSLSEGIGEEGKLKDALVQTIAQQATPEYAASVDRNYAVALNQALNSRPIRVALGMPDARPGSIRAVASEEPAVSVVLNTGERITGTKLEETKDWLVITTADGRRVRVRPQEVRRIDEAGKAPAKPAVDD